MELVIVGLLIVRVARVVDVAIERRLSASVVDVCGYMFLFG